MISNNENSDSIIAFIEFTKCDYKTAQKFIQLSGGNTDIALILYEKEYFSPKTKLHYCGLFVKDWDSSYKRNFTNGQCGPTNGPNCKECRKPYNPFLYKINDEGRKVWQGESGRYYCGVFFQKMYALHDGRCGPNDGISCESCQRLLK